MSDAPILICARTDSLPQTEATPGSIEQWCIFCAESVWLSVEGQRFAEMDPTVRVVCTECAVGLMANEPDPPPMEPVPGMGLGPGELHAAMALFHAMVEAEKERRR